MATIGTAYVQIVPSAKGIKGSITNALGGEADNAGDEAGKGIAGKIKGAIAAAKYIKGKDITRKQKKTE